MKAVVVLLVCAIIGFACAQNKYTSKYDNVDVERILNNDRILNNYIRCMMDEGPCTSEGRELKKTLPDALSSGCTKCNENQKTAAEKVIRHLINKRNRDWDRLSKKYDPKGDYKKKYEQQLKQSGVIA